MYQRTILFGYLLFTICSLEVNCYSQTVLDVHFNSLQSGRAILVNTRTGKLDTAIVENGHLSFHENINEPTLFTLKVEGFDIRPMNFIISNQRTEVEFTKFKKAKKDKKIKSLYPNQPVFIEDPNQNKIFYDFNSEWMTFYDTIMALSSSDSKDLLEKRKEIYYSFIHRCEEIIIKHRDNYVSAVIIEYLLRNNLLQIESIQKFYEYLAPTIKDSFFGILIGEYAGKVGRLQPGSDAPSFEMTNVQKGKYNSADLKGKKVLMHFWSSSCAPCIKEALELISLADRYKDKLLILNISLDTEKGRWMKGIERAGISSMNNFCDFNSFQGKIALDYDVKILPTYYLIDERGRISVKGTLNQMKEELKTTQR